jgi:hypothetical protein
MSESRKDLIVASTLLLALACATIFLVPVFPAAYQPRLYDVLFTLIVPACAFALQRNRKIILVWAFGVTVAEWATSRLGLLIASAVSRASLILFFVGIVISLIIQVARTRQVTSRVIIDSICGYLLMGIVFTLMVGLLMMYQHEAFNLPAPRSAADSQSSPLSNYFYFTFVTFATLGYGDVVPKTSCAKSLATLIAVVGQLYLATIIAMLVGKYVSMASMESSMSKE